MKRLRRYLPVLMCLVLVTSCSSTGEEMFGKPESDLIDPELGLNRTDYKHMLDRDYLAANNRYDPSEPPIPDLTEILAAPTAPKLAETKLVSVAITEDVPLKDVLIEVARLADVDIEVDSSISGGISFRAKDRPFNEVIDRITNLANLRYSTANGVLRIERDTPYIQIYSLDLLNVERNSKGNIGVNTGTGGGGGSGGAFSSGVSSGSSSEITATAESDFWEQFENGISQILSYEETSRISGATISSQIQNAGEVESPNGTPAAAKAGSRPNQGQNARNNQQGGGQAQQNGGQQSAQSPNNNATRPAAVATEVAPRFVNAAPGKSFYVLNRQASTLTVSATEKQHAILKRFIGKIEDNASAQVLIEAKIVEVELNDAYKSGIDWSFMNKNVSLSSKATSPTSNLASFTSFALNKTGAVGNFDLSSAVTLVEEFGTTRTLSSPRLHATNNQQAVLTFADNLVFFELKFDISDAVLGTNGNITQPAKTKVTSTIHTVPIGILLSLQPSINIEKNEVTLSVRPTLSRILNFTEDPSVPISLASAGITNLDIKSLVPVVEVRELDSILKVRSGQVMVIGGLMESKSVNSDVGPPGLSSVPYVGNFFKSVDKDNSSKELVIFIRATIVSPHGSADSHDKNFYERFSRDPHPLFDKKPVDDSAVPSLPPPPEPREEPVGNVNAAPLWPTDGGDVPVVDIPPPSPVATSDLPPSPNIPPLVPLVH